MGLIKGLIDQDIAFQNSSKCNTWNDVYASHSVEGRNIVLNFEDIYGMAILLSIGLGAALVVFIYEKLVYCVHENKVVQNKVRISASSVQKLIPSSIDPKLLYQALPRGQRRDLPGQRGVSVRAHMTSSYMAEKRKMP